MLTMYESMKVVQAVRDIVKENPEVIYHQEGGYCYYTKGKATNGQCGCLIGQAIIKVYPELEEKLKQIDNELNTVPAADSLIEYHLMFEESLGSMWLGYVQSQQDNGKTWEHAVEYTDRNYPLS